MKTTKFLLLFAFYFSLFTLCSAQSDAKKKSICDKLIHQSEYIFEGKIISSKYDIILKTGEQTHYNFNSYIVQVQKVLKGNIQKGTIEIIETAPGSVYKVGEHIVSAPIMSDGNPTLPPLMKQYIFVRQKQM